MIKSLEERIVNLTKVTTDNVETTVEAELRQLEMKGGVPIQVSVVLAKEENFQFTMEIRLSAKFYIIQLIDPFHQEVLFHERYVRYYYKEVLFLRKT